MDIFMLEKKLKESDFITTHQEDNSLRAELKHKNALVGIYYFVFKNDIFDNEFDLIQFQEGLLAEDYYNNRGAIQWNYYLVFVINDKKMDNLSEKEKMKKEKIESNVIFSRKYVVGSSGIEKIILRANFEMLSKLERDNIDISTIWIEKLKKAQLDGVFLNEGLSFVVDQYINGNPIVEDEECIDNNSDIITNDISFIKNIHIKQYRPVFPKNMVINFGKVNLIRGPNGVGKTSLLEALELVVCGRTFRSGNKIEPNADLEVEFCNVKDIDKYASTDNKKYRDRDSKWYGSSGYKAGNKLSESFNKYNFYDTDAAYRFAYNTDVEDIKNAFFSLALGKRANFIDERLRKFQGRFKAEYNRLDKEINELEDHISDWENTIKKIVQKGASPEILFKETVTKLKKMKWIGNHPENKDGGMVLLERDLSYLKSKVRHFDKKADWLKFLTIKDLEEHFNYHEIMIEYADKIKKKKSDLEILEKELSELNKKHEIFLEAAPYFMEEKIEKLDHIKKDIIKMEEREKMFSALDEYLTDVNLDIYRDIASTVKEYDAILQRKKTQLEKTSSKNELKIQNIKDSIDQMKNLLEEVRFSAKQMVEINPNLKNCPLCNASYEKGELLNRIEKHSLRFKNSSLEGLLLKRVKIKKELEIIHRKIGDYRKILKAFDLAFDGKKIYLNKSFSNNILNLDDKLKALRGDIKRLENLHFLYKKFSVKGLEADTYKTLNKRFGEYGFSISHSNKSRYISEKETINADLIEIQDQIQEVRGEIKSIEKSMDSTWGEYIVLCNPISHSQERIREGKRELKEAISAVDEIKRFVSVDDTVILSSLLTAIDEIEVGIGNYKKAKANIEVNNSYSDKIRENRDSINELQIKYNRAKKAKDVIEELINKYSKEATLKEFLSKNTKSIINIFSRIHTPYEGFTDISMDDNGIMLCRGKETVQINQISTGQRTALYISVFIVLNCSLKGGPPYIIFDDPIAHTDDLNILFFLDFLRDIALYSDRQVFFSTANRKIASLFEKKFSFLGDDFVSYDLKRVLGEVEIQAI